MQFLLLTRLASQLNYIIFHHSITILS
uniref:Uncharacterized protein n=1 Tax=Anguilla anguilla TaxID=7936 RepID=A0A0E9S724_ANGAN